jgi:acetyl esterase/lipase
MKNNGAFASTNNSFLQVRSFLFILSIVISTSNIAQQKVIQLYNGAAPGSENWTWREQETNKNPINARIAYNVTHPTLTVFLPDSALTNGTAVIVCPGGGLHVLVVDYNGTEVAKELTKKGIIVLLLKYRLIHSLTDDPWKEMMSSVDDSASEIAVLKMAEKDAENAMIYVRQHAAEFGIDPHRIGIMGFSSGGTLAAFLAYYHTPATRPDFVAPIYADTEDFEKSAVPQDAPPLFIAAASDDQLTPVSNSVNLYNAWLASKHSVELHLYSKGKHGLHGFPADSWIIRFEEWLDVQGLLKSKH